MSDDTGNGTTPESMEERLGTLIRMLNPYSDTMHITLDDPPNQEQANALVAEQPKMDAPLNCIIEMETRQVEYMTWEFKDLPRRVRRAVRIEYRHPVRKDKDDPNSEILCWVVDHLLIGYEGTNGG